jgi:hypothetical protein
MNPEAFNEFIKHIRWLGLPGAEIIIGMAAVGAGFSLIRADDGELQAALS